MEKSGGTTVLHVPALLHHCQAPLQSPKHLTKRCAIVHIKSLHYSPIVIIILIVVHTFLKCTVNAKCCYISTSWNNCKTSSTFGTIINKIAIFPESTRCAELCP